MLDGAASDAQRIAGPYYTGAVVSDPTNSVTVYLAHAPQSVLDRLRKAEPGTYVIKNDAPRPLSTVMRLQRSFPINALKADGITVSEIEPTVNGYLRVGVVDHVAEAQAKLDAKYGAGVIRVFQQDIGHYY
jgi:hypothetical protein